MTGAAQKPLAQGKTKAIYAVDGNPKVVRIKSLDTLTAFNAQRRSEIAGKSEIASRTTCNVFRFLAECGVRSAFLRELSASEFEAECCEMVPIEWVARRVATGSWLKRNPGVAEGYTFLPPLVQTHYKDDANDDPLWSKEQILAANFEFNGRKIGQHEFNFMERTTSVVFRILERAWRRHGCVLVDMKIEFGVTPGGEVVLADVIDNDSWRVWPNGDRRLQLDKQIFRDLPKVTDEALNEVKKNYDRVRDLTHGFLEDVSQPRAAIVMGSAADLPMAQKISEHLAKLGVRAALRVCSAHKSTAEVLDIIAEYEGDATPTVFIAIAGRSNGLGPVMSANTVLPVFNAPPLTADWGAQDVWSSLRMPSGIGCATVLGADEVALAAAKSFANSDHLVFGRILAAQLNNIAKIFESDRAALESAKAAKKEAQ